MSFRPPSTSKRDSSRRDSLKRDSTSSSSSSSSSSTSSSQDSRRPRPPVKQNYSTHSVQSGGGKANAILGIGIGHPPIASSRVSTPINKDPIIDNWDVSDNEAPAKPISLKPWGPLAVSAKKVPSIGSIRSLDRRPARSSSSSSGRFVKPKIENPQPKHVVRARFSEMRGYDADDMKRKGSPLDSGVAFKLVHHPTHSQSSADIRLPPKPRRAQTMGKMQSNEGSGTSSRSSSTSSIRLPKRSPSAPIGPRTSAQSFELTELPVVFSALPLEGTDSYNIVPTEFIVPDSRSPSPPPVQPMHPSWSKFDESVAASTDAARKAELNAMAAMMDPSSQQAMSFRSKYPMDSAYSGNLEVPSPNNHASIVRPNSRWSDYSEADSIKESWRSSVLNHFHLPSVMSVRRKLDLRVPVAAAKEGIRKMGTKEIHEIKEEDAAPGGGNRPRSGEAGTFNPALNSHSAAASHSKGNTSANGGIFRSRTALGRSDSIVTLSRSKSILRPESARIEKVSISAPQPHGTPTPSSSRPVSTATRPVSTATQRGSIRGRPDSSPLATTATTATTTVEVGSPGSGDEVASPGSRRFKDVFEKYMVKDTKKKAEERRRNELKKMITVIANEPGRLI
ncbi:hypothetical protein P167DRAFT_277252 [Morchella conica CCBAS932]|uniref:Uncharacterized protein n=2 Tax=Morchella sect. Distantes TaxID=1051054 RepID=A0A3N4KLI0_9PEZI|nr:hypothetical protein P167DRAFT_277252 [Morchella conica CCBAS932]